MAIGTNAPIDFFGTQDTVTAGGGTSSVANSAFSAAGDVVSGGWTNDDDAITAAAVLTCAYSVAPTAGTSIALYARLMNIDGTADAITPDSTLRRVPVGVFPVKSQTASQSIPTEINLPNHYTSQVYDIYIENSTGQTISAGWTLKITPKAIGPHP